jgi:hypothetical protein
MCVRFRLSGSAEALAEGFCEREWGPKVAASVRRASALLWRACMKARREVGLSMLTDESEAKDGAELCWAAQVVPAWIGWAYEF